MINRQYRHLARHQLEQHRDLGTACTQLQGCSVNDTPQLFVPGTGFCSLEQKQATDHKEEHSTLVVRNVTSLPYSRDKVTGASTATTTKKPKTCSYTDEDFKKLEKEYHQMKRQLIETLNKITIVLKALERPNLSVDAKDLSYLPTKNRFAYSKILSEKHTYEELTAKVIKNKQILQEAREAITLVQREDIHPAKRAPALQKLRDLRDSMYE